MRLVDAEKAFREKLSKTILTIEGEVSRLLPDDNKGIQHQKFVVRIHDNHTILVAHNLERGYKIPIKIGDKVEVRGTYVWNRYGGIIHNTHHDDRKECGKTSSGDVVCGPIHEDGWIILAEQKDLPRKTKK